MATSSDKYVLVVEDDGAVRKLEMEILRGAHYDVDQAADGAEALRSIAQRRPDLVVLDLVMPVIDGWGVLASFKTMADPPPVIVVSGQNEDVAPGQLGPCVAGYLRKPFAVARFLDACARAIAIPTTVPASGNRKDPRRSFVVEATLLSGQGAPAVRADLRQISRRGFQIELVIPIQPGDPVRIAFQVPGREKPLELSGRVRWRDERTLGAEIEKVSPTDQALLQGLISDDAKPGSGSSGA